MKDQYKTEQKLIEELEALRKQVTKLKGMETKRKHAEDALLFTRFSLDNAVDTMVCVDRDARFIDVNDAFCRSSGYSREELLSKTVHDIDPDYSAEIWPEFWEKLKQSGSLTFETCHRSKEGRIFPVEITASYLEYNGKEYHCSFARDITERKEAEQLLKEREALLNEVGAIAKVGGWEMDMATSEATWSKGTYDIVEIDYDKPVPGLHEHVGYYLPEYREMIENKMKALIETKQPMKFEAALKTAKGIVLYRRI